MAKKQKKHASKAGSQPQVVAPPPWSDQLLEWLDRRALLLFFVLVLIGSIRIVATYPVFNHTIDEPAHVACGMEWLTKGAYSYDHQHPPLARVMTALGPYLAGAHSWNMPGIYNEGAAVLYAEFHYRRNLFLARLGILPFFWIACWVVFVWSSRLFGRTAAVLATLLFTALPPVLAHAGLATTDMALTAMLGAALLATGLWLERPSLLRTLAFGASVGLAVLSKLSALAFFPVALLAMLLGKLIAERSVRGTLRSVSSRHVLTFALAALVGALVIWAGYRFSFGQVHFAKLRLPAPEFYSGIRSILDHNAKGHPSYLLGQRSDSGWWYFFPVVLAVKTPLAFLALALWGCVLCWRRRRESAFRAPMALAAGLLALAMFSRINIGVRHILPVYIGLAMIAAVGALDLLKKARGAAWAGWVVGMLSAWLIVSGGLAHPDYLAYFNALAGEEPEKILVDSDLDWGQDMDRLAQRLKELGARNVTFSPFIVAYFREHHGFPPMQEMDPVRPSPGWNAVSLTMLKLTRLGLFNDYPRVKLWPELVKPTERVGSGVLLYYFPPRQTPPR